MTLPTGPTRTPQVPHPIREAKQLNPYQTPKSEMVERVARAIHRSDHSGPEFEPHEAESWSMAETRGVYIAHARAAIEAMREPTWEMAVAGVAGYAADGVEADFARDGSGIGMQQAYRAMIDAALKPEGGS